MRLKVLVVFLLLSAVITTNLLAGGGKRLPESDEVAAILIKVNDYFQEHYPNHGRSFWDNAAYHTGNLEAYHVTGKKDYLDYSMAWAVHNQWKGAKSDNPKHWRYSYGESNNYVLFGDWQICFQVYMDIYELTGKTDPEMVARAKEVMSYQVQTDTVDYWWWADALYMVMPVMTKMYHLTGEDIYLDKLYEYFNYAKSIMYDEETGLFFRDAKYVYPRHKSLNGMKDFWSRGDGWVFAGLARILEEIPSDHEYFDYFLEHYKRMAKSLKEAHQAGGYWTRSLLDPEHAPGPETSGTAFYTYGFLWGLNNKVLSKKKYLETALRGWEYLTEFAIDDEGKVGYIQPIGEKAIPGQVVDKNSSYNFGVGAFLLAASEMYRFTK